MSIFLTKLKSYLQNSIIKKILRITAYVFIGIIGLIIVSTIGFKIYFESNKTEIVKELNTEINKSISGTVQIGDVNFKLLTGFPNMTLGLNNVVVKDSLWNIHKRTLLKAKQIEVRVSPIGILRKKINIRKIVIIEATIDLFKDKNGVSNSNIFKPQPKKKDTKSDASAKIGGIVLQRVNFISENQQRNKLFHFEVASLKGDFNYSDDDFKVKLYLNVFAKSMAFNALKGSFIKNKKVEGDLDVSFSSKKKKIDVVTKDLAIGEDSFDITAYFNVAKDNSLFGLDISTKIKWKNATNLLADNISSKLNHFDIKEPLSANCTIDGDLNAEADPVIEVNAKVEDNEFHIPDGVITDCNFDAKYTNCFKKGEETSDANSAVILTNFTGNYKAIPFSIPKASINNFDNLIAKGTLKSKFKLPQLKEMVNDNFVTFIEGDANVNLDFTVDIEDFRLKKPQYIGDVSVTNASLNYIPKNITLNKTDILLNFTQNTFSVKKVKFINKANEINMEFTIDNYLNLYYNDPEKIVVKWNIYSPYLDVKQSLGFFGSSKTKKTASKAPKKGGFTNKLVTILDKCQMEMNFKADKLKYNHLTGTNAKATILWKNNTLIIPKGGVTTCGGTIAFGGQMNLNDNWYSMKSKVGINRVDISKFLAGFNNFGIKSFSPSSIKGRLSVNANLTGKVANTGDLVQNSLRGNANFNTINGSLTNFAPLIKIDRFMKNRDLKNINFSELKGDMNLAGEDIILNDLRVSSSVLNVDVKGIYSFGNKTNLAIDIPLRNPKDDSKIKDEAEREKLRTKGIVLKLAAVDNDGKIKIKMR